MRDETISKFLEAGRAFRITNNIGDVVIIDCDATSRACMKRWASSFRRPIIVSYSYSDAMYKEENGAPSIILCGVDGYDGDNTDKYFSHINEKYPACFVLAYTDNPDYAHELRKRHPRISTLVKGSNIEALMDDLDHELPTRMEAV